jgi:TetR/AcrR family transcriptional regulator, transcriptional repressor of aconitase
MPRRRTLSPLSSKGVSSGPVASSPRRGRPDKAKLGSTRDRILTAAERLFAEEGFSGVSMPTIAEASGITAGAIYKHFDGKDDLFFEVVRRTVRSVPAPEAAEAATAGIALLPRIAAMYTTPGLKRLRQLAVEIHYASARHPRVAELLRRSLGATIEEISAQIVAAQQAGKLDGDVDPALLASAVMAFIMGLMHMESLLPHLVGDAKWHDFVQNRVATLMGLR